MASQQPPYQDDGPDPEGGQPYSQNGAYDESQQAGNAAPGAAAAKKKRAYAGQAYEFGVGGNAAMGAPPGGAAPYPGQGQPQMGGYGYQASPAPQQPGFGMPQQPAYADPAMQSPAPQQTPYGQPQYGAQGGYEAPAPGYPTPAQPGMPPQGVQGMTQQFSQMGVGGQPPAPQQPQQPGVQMRLNPLQPVDISVQGQPFHVSDLEQPPPSIILPPNVRRTKPGALVTANKCL